MPEKILGTSTDNITTSGITVNRVGPSGITVTGPVYHTSFEFLDGASGNPRGQLNFRVYFPAGTAQLKFAFKNAYASATTYPIENAELAIDTILQGTLSAEMTVALSQTQITNGYVAVEIRNRWPVRVCCSARTASLGPITINAAAGFVDCGLRIKDDTGTTQTIACKDTTGMTAAELATFPLRINSSKIGGTKKTYGIALVNVPIPPASDPNATKIRVRINSTTVKALRKYP